MPKRGRPHKSVKRPKRFHLDIWLAVNRYIAEEGRRTGKTISISEACRDIADLGGMRWLCAVGRGDQTPDDKMLGFRHRIRAAAIGDSRAALLADPHGAVGVVYALQHADSIRAAYYDAAKELIEADELEKKVFGDFLADVTGVTRFNAGWVVGWRPRV